MWARDIALMKSIAAGAAQSSGAMAELDPRRIIEVDKYFETPVYESLNAGVTEFSLTKEAGAEIYKIIDDCFAMNEKPVMKFLMDGNGFSGIFAYIPINAIYSIKFTSSSPEAPALLTGHSSFYTDNNFVDVYCAIDRFNYSIVVRMKPVTFD